MKKYVKFGKVEFIVEFNGFSGGKAYVTVWSTWYYKEHVLKMYFRHERTLDDHMGNTDCGYYVNIFFPYGIGKRRVYCLFGR